MSATGKSTARALDAKASPAPTRNISSAPRQILQRKCACATANAECETCQKKEREQMLQKSASGPGRASVAPPVVGHVLNSPGRPLEPATRSFMEPRFGRDFSGVRIHNDSQAAESAHAVDAHAYTVGQHIVFDHGKYDPHSNSGRDLLAHELAHTVQQHGLQRSSNDLSLGETPEYHRLEHEADSIAHAVMSSPGGTVAPSLTTQPARPIISRKDNPARKNAPDDDAKQTEKLPKKATSDNQTRGWETAPPALKKAGVKQMARPDGDPTDGALVVKMRDPFKVPKEKGDVVETWRQRADAGALEALLDETGKVQLKQERPDTKELRAIWLQKVKWEVGDADKKWKEAGGDTKSFDPPRAGGVTCHVDHIVELQFGGNNVPDNLQMLDGDENMASGRQIAQGLKDKSAELRDALKDAKLPNYRYIAIHYDVAAPGSGKAPGPCFAAEKKARKGAAKADSIIEGEPYEIKAGGTAATLSLLPGKKSTPISDQPGSTIIPGMVLQTFHSAGGPGKDTVAAHMETRDTRTRLPVELKKEKAFTLNVLADRSLKLHDKRPNIQFHYQYLSDGTFTDLNIEDDGTLSGKGKIKPTVPFLREFDIEFNKDTFRAVANLDAKKLKSPIPAAKITHGSIGLELAPAFKPTGDLGFEVMAGAKKMLDAELTVSADTNGLLAKGTIHAYLPGVDNATGEVAYSNGEWTGGVTIEATQLKNKLKYVDSGSVVVGFSKKGITAAGTVNLAIPHTDGVSVSLLYQQNKWLFRGKGQFSPPRLKPVTIEIEYDGNHIEGMAETGFEFHGLQGHLKLLYRDEHFSGEGTIEIKKGRATGKLHVKMRQVGTQPKFSGEGEVSYQISEGVIAKGGIAVDENEKVRLTGALLFPKPIPLFKPFGGDYNIFEIGVSIPIPGASIGPIGLKARIEGALSAGYQIGPGELRNAKIEAAFDPLEDKPDLDVLISAQVWIGANVHVSGSISGLVEVDVGIASLSGGLKVTATATLEGHAASEVSIHYTKSRLEVDADFRVLLSLALALALDAVVKAKAGIGPFSVSTSKTWNLAAIRFDTGMQLGMRMKKPLHYASDEGFQFPSLSDIEWITPTIDPQQMLERVFSGGGKETEE
jgi:hypothetical protein